MWYGPAMGKDRKIILCPVCNYEVRDDDDTAEDIIPVDGAPVDGDTPYLKAHRSCLEELNG